MNRTLLRLLCAALGLAASAACLIARDIIPVETFFGLPAIASPRLSPDGIKIAFLFPKDGRLALGLFDRKSNDGRIVLESPDENISFFFWKGNDRIVFGGDVNGSESLFIGATDLTGKKIQRLAESIRRITETFTIYGDLAGLVSELPEDPENIILRGNFMGDVEHALAVASFPEVQRIDLRTKARTRLLTMQVEQEMLWGNLVADRAGVVRLAEREQFKDFVWQLRNDNNATFRDLVRFPIHGYAETWEPLEFSADNTTLWLISREEHDQGALYAYNIATRERGPALFVPPEGEIENIVTDYHATRLLGVSYYTDRRHYQWFDKTRASVQAKLENTFKGYSCRIVSSSDDDQVHLVLVGSDRDPGTYYILDLKQPSLALFKHIRPEINPAQMRPKTYVAFKARDGLELHGYLTLPAGAEGKRVPLVIHPHGGPFGVRDYWGFDNEVQFLASRGYAVLQVNYRGSGGYGREFINKGRYQWGRAMQDDLTDAVHWAVEQGVADPRRVAIYGASYGGYAVLAGLTLTPDLYCCGVNYVGAADLAITFKNRGGDAGMTDRDFNPQKEWVGPDTGYLAATSPINFIDRIRVPSLHAYGENDPRVRIDHWERLEAQLKKYNKPYIAIVEKKQGHGFRNEGAAIRFHKAVDEFFAKYLAPAP
jgi:dipeptidyl aminopeptidase/acylaminoacyl peptidase